MRVDDCQLAGNQATQSGKASAAQEVERRADSRQFDSRRAGGADRVELSDLTGGMARTLQASATERANRVEQLGRDVSEGRYRPEPIAVSRAIMAEMRVAGQA
jgi:anti-sigma28 factor (negative regulator of flagellin synthesis)